VVPGISKEHVDVIFKVHVEHSFTLPKTRILNLLEISVGDVDARNL
jgi:hypothetical protein